MSDQNLTITHTPIAIPFQAKNGEHRTFTLWVPMVLNDRLNKDLFAELIEDLRKSLIERDAKNNEELIIGNHITIRIVVIEGVKVLSRILATVSNFLARMRGNKKGQPVHAVLPEPREVIEAYKASNFSNPASELALAVLAFWDSNETAIMAPELSVQACFAAGGIVVSYKKGIRNCAHCGGKTGCQAQHAFDTLNLYVKSENQE